MVATTSRDDVILALTGPGQRFEIISEDVSGVTMRTYRHAMSSLREVLLFSEHFDDREFLVYQDDRWTYRQHMRMVAEFARYLSEGLGVVAGDRVAIAMRNFPEWSVAFWAAEAIGAVVVPLNAWWIGPELAFAIRDSGSCVLVLDSERLVRLQPLLASLDLRKVILVRGDDVDAADGVDLWQQVCTGLDDDSTLPDARIAPDDPSTIVYTSGTTGTPKGALHVHRNHCTSVMNNLLFAEAGRILAEAAAADAPVQAAARQPASLLTFPFFHIAGLVNLYLPLSSGSKLVLMRRWNVEEAVRLIIEEGISSTAVVPTVLRELLDSDRLQAAGGATLASLAAGGASVPASLIRRIGAQFGTRVSPGNGYGLTETTAGVIATSGADYLAHPDSIGRAFPVVDARIVGVDGSPCGVDEIGELWVRGPQVVPGYWNNPTATAEAFTDGWFHTGDLARRDADGRYYIADRLKDVVIRGGENVYCAEVEAALLEHPEVDDVAVIGMPHELLGEEVVAVVRLVTPGGLDEPTLIAYASDCLAYYKVPARMVVWATELPRTPSGKVLKRVLREQILLDDG